MPLVEDGRSRNGEVFVLCSTLAEDAESQCKCFRIVIQAIELADS